MGGMTLSPGCSFYLLTDLIIVQSITNKRTRGTRLSFTAAG